MSLMLLSWIMAEYGMNGEVKLVLGDRDALLKKVREIRIWNSYLKLTDFIYAGQSISAQKSKKGIGGEITNYGDKSRKSFLAVTLVTILSIVAVVSVFAVLLGSFTGGEVTVGGMVSSNVMYSLVNADPGTWTSTLSPSGPGAAWYSRLEIPSGGYSGPVTITWLLQNKTGASTWENVTGASALTTMVLSGGAQNVYATSDGVFAVDNHNWGSNVAVNGTYRVVVSVGSA